MFLRWDKMAIGYAMKSLVVIEPEDKRLAMTDMELTERRSIK